MERRRTSLDKGYRQGDLSVFPQAIDSHYTLFEASNNLETKLSHKLMLMDKYIIVENASAFPFSGILRITSAKGTITPEVLYYGKKIGNQFHLLQRGHGINTANTWEVGAIVSCPVMAEHHNALKDAIIKIQQKIGLPGAPEPESILGILQKLEQRWLTPKAVYKAFPTSGALPLTVRFQNFSVGNELHYLWDFGDGFTSTEKNPIHTYLNEGNYTVKLNIVSTNNAQGFSEKSNYITVSNELRQPFFYGRPLMGKSGKTEFFLVDQTDGNIIERHWFFGDGSDITISNPNNHVVKHVYEEPGTYMPNLIVKYADQLMSRTTITEGITVL